MSLDNGSNVVHDAEQASETVRETERPHIFEKFEKKYPRTPIVNRTMFGTEPPQLIAKTAVFW